MLAPAEHGRPRAIMSLGEAKGDEVMGLCHLGRLKRARDLLAVRGFDTTSTVLACYSGNGFTDDLTTAALQDENIRLIGLEQMYPTPRANPRHRHPIRPGEPEDKPTNDPERIIPTVLAPAVSQIFAGRRITTSANEGRRSRAGFTTAAYAPLKPIREASPCPWSRAGHCGTTDRSCPRAPPSCVSMPLESGGALRPGRTRGRTRDGDVSMPLESGGALRRDDILLGQEDRSVEFLCPWSRAGHCGS